MIQQPQGPTVRVVGDVPGQAPGVPAQVEVPESGSIADAIAQAGRAARRQRFWDYPLDLAGPIQFGVRLGLPSDASITVVDDQEGGVPLFSDVEFIAHRILCVIQLVDNEWQAVEGYSLKDLATMHARAMENDPTLEPFEDDAPALQQLFTMSDPPEVNVQAIAIMARGYRLWAAGGAEEDGGPTSGP